MNTKVKIEKPEYVWGEAYKKFNQGKVTAEQAAEEILRIEKINGSISAQDLIDVSKDPKSVLHPCLDWEDRVAGPKWRLEQSRSLLASPRVIIVAGEPPRPLMLNVILTDTKKPAYMNSPAVMSNADYSIQAYKRAFAEFANGGKRFQNIKELYEIYSEAMERVESLIKNVS